MHTAVIYKNHLQGSTETFLWISFEVHWITRHTPGLTHYTPGFFTETPAVLSVEELTTNPTTTFCKTRPIFCRTSLTHDGVSNFLSLWWSVQHPVALITIYNDCTSIPQNSFGTDFKALPAEFWTHVNLNTGESDSCNLKVAVIAPYSEHTLLKEFFATTGTNYDDDDDAGHVLGVTKRPHSGQIYIRTERRVISVRSQCALCLRLRRLLIGNN